MRDNVSVCTSHTPSPPTSAFLRLPPVQLLLVAPFALSLGAISALPVFTEPMQSRGRAIGAAWTPSVALINILCSPVVVSAAVALSRAAGAPQRAALLRTQAALAAGGFLAFALAALASRVAVVTGVVALAVPQGLLVVLVVEHVAAWLPPARLGLALGLFRVALGSGTLLGAAFFRFLLTRISVSAAIIVAATAAGVPGLLLCPLLDLPDGAEQHSEVPSPDSASLTNEVDALLQLEDELQGGGDFARQPLLAGRRGVEKYKEHVDAVEALAARGELQQPDKLSWRALLDTRAFWLFCFVVLSYGATFPFLPYFFALGGVHAAATQVAILQWFQLGTGLSILWNLATASLCDVLHTRSGPLASGARNLMAAQLATQTLGFGFLALCDADRRFALWAATATALRLCYHTNTTVTALLAADFFGRRNMGLVYGVGFGVALGSGEATGAALMALVERFSPLPGTAKHYAPYYATAMAWSAAALAALLSLRRLRRQVPATLA